MSDEILALVGCGDKKRELARGMQCPARRLYTSTYFEQKRSFAERLCDRWFILSARHGLLHPATEVGPYDQSVRDFDVRERAQWATEVAESLLDELTPGTTVVFLAGRDYVEPVSDRLLEALDEPDPERFYDPFFETAGIGEQLGWLEAAITAGDPLYPARDEDATQTASDHDAERADDQANLATFSDESDLRTEGGSE